MAKQAACRCRAEKESSNPVWLAVYIPEWPLECCFFVVMLLVCNKDISAVTSIRIAAVTLKNTIAVVTQKPHILFV